MSVKYDRPDDHTSTTYDMIPGFKPFTVLFYNNRVRVERRVPGECRKAVSLGSFIKSIHEQNAIKDIDFSNLYSKTF